MNLPNSIRVTDDVQIVQKSDQAFTFLHLICHGSQRSVLSQAEQNRHELGKNLSPSSMLINLCNMAFFDTRSKAPFHLSDVAARVAKACNLLRNCSFFFLKHRKGLSSRQTCLSTPNGRHAAAQRTLHDGGQESRAGGHIGRCAGSQEGQNGVSCTRGGGMVGRPISSLEKLARRSGALKPTGHAETSSELTPGLPGTATRSPGRTALPAVSWPSAATQTWVHWVQGPPLAPAGSPTGRPMKGHQIQPQLMLHGTPSQR